MDQGKSKPWEGMALTARELELAEYLHSRGKAAHLERMLKKRKPLRGSRHNSVENNNENVVEPTKKKAPPPPVPPVPPQHVTVRRHRQEEAASWVAAQRRDRATAAVAFAAECSMQRAAELELEVDRLRAEVAALRACATHAATDLSCKLEEAFVRAITAEAELERMKQKNKIGLDPPETQSTPRQTPVRRSTRLANLRPASSSPA